MAKETSWKGQRSRASMLLGTYACLYVAVVVLIVATQRYLFADGSRFLLEFLEQQSISSWYWARHFAHGVTQGPAVLALREFGIRNPLALGSIYGASLFLHQLLGLLLSAWACRRQPAVYLALPLLSQAALFLSSSFFIVAEVHVAPSLFWPALYLMLFAERVRGLEGGLLLLVLLLLTRTYEASMLFALPLGFVAWRRLSEARARGEPVEALVLAGSGVLILATVGVGAYFLAFPPPLGSPQRSSFIAAVWSHLGHPPAAYALAAALLAPCCVFRSQVRTFLRGGLVLAMLAGGAAIMATPALRPEAMGAALQYEARVQSIYIPVILGALAVAWRFGWLSFDRVARPLWFLTCVVLVVALGFQLGATLRWNEYRHAFLQDLRAGGLRDFDASRIGGRGVEGMRFQQFNWSWTTPSASVALGALNFGRVDTIIRNAGAVRWEPFSPEDPDSFPVLDDYGVVYSARLLNAASR